jgi:uncharacterized protein YneF (UPF0154 family)
LRRPVAKKGEPMIIHLVIGLALIAGLAAGLVYLIQRMHRPDQAPEQRIPEG